MSAGDDRFRAAARGYFVYGIVYWVGGFWLWLHDVGRGSMWSIVWILLGAAFVVLIPFLLRRPRPWFERWVLTRRDFARIVALFLFFRVLGVAGVVFRSSAAAVAPAPWGGFVSYRVGGAVFLVITLAALVLVARAAWQREP